MHTTRSPTSIPTGGAGDALDLSLTGSQLSVTRRPSSASPGKYFSRSVSVSVASEGRGKRNTLGDAAFSGSRSIKNLRRSNSTTQVNQQASVSLSEECSEDFQALFDSSSNGRRKLASLSKASPDRTTWNILDDQPRAFPLPSSSRSVGSMDSPTGPKKREPGSSGVTLAANFTANNRSNKGAVGNSVTTILHNNYSEKPLTPKSSNQKPSFNNIIKATVHDESSLENGSLTKSQKNFSSSSSASASNNNALRSPSQPRRREVSEEEAERYIQQVAQAVVTIQRWYRRHIKRRQASEMAVRRLLITKKKEREQRLEEEGPPEKRRDEDRKRIREEKARLARLTAIQELQQKRAQRVAEVQQAAEEEVEALRRAGKVGRKKSSKSSPANQQPGSPTDVKAKNTDSNVNLVPELDDIQNLRAVSPALSGRRDSQCSQEILERSVSMEDQRQGASSSRAQSKTTLNDLLDTIKLLEEEPERLSEPKSYRKEKYAWIDEDGDSTSLTADNLELHGQLSQPPVLPDGGALLSEAKLQSIMSFLDEMEKSEQERPRSVTSGSHREALLSEEELAGVEQASATAAEVTGTMMRLKMDLEEKRRTVNMLQAALNQQRELTIRHVKETEKELNRSMQQQREQYEATIQRHLSFIDQLIDDKKALSERCEGVVAELKQVDQKYTKKIAQMQEQHEMVWQILGPLCEEIKKLKELMSATEKVRREKWIDEKTKKIKEITVKGLEPEIQKLISRHRQELRKLRVLHEAELQQADERAAQRYVRQTEELRLQLERERDEQCQRERELAKQRLEKQLQEEETALQQQKRRLYKEVAEEKERLTQLASRVKRVRDKYEAELRELERSERSAQEKQQELRKRQGDMEAELLRLQALLRQREQEMQDVTESRDKLSEERRSLAEVIRQEFAERLVQTEEDNRRMKTEVAEVRARLRLEVERVSREKEEELAEVHQRVKSAILKKEETVNNLRKQHEAAVKRADHLEALLEQQRKQLLGK
ncbi:centrosomal protein of 131 kDa [Alosa alosa]|uniref:centrosomal protein of 131 kDa n=1 Tax=Alosa alosa TaxID=278164 RepID=UPI0020151E03|nr:centrosomal protein of 131 kDa [Alosa alosa]